MRPPRWLYRRRYRVTHNRAGFHLAVVDCWAPGLAAEYVVGKIVAALGHPCCGRGLGRIPGIDTAGWRFLNLPNKLVVRDREVLRVPLTEAQALAIQPDWAEYPWWREELDA